MSESVRAGVYRMLLVAGLSATAAQPHAEQQSNINTIGWSQNFIIAAYPEINANDVMMQVVASPRWPWNGLVPVVRLAFFREPYKLPQPGRTSREAMAQTLLAADFRFTPKGGHLDSFSARGVLTNALPLFDLLSQVDNQRMDNEAIDGFLRESQVRFGPWAQAELMKHLNLHQYEAFIGTFRLNRVRFVGRDSESPDGAANLAWEINVRTEDGRAYDFYVEPIGGRIQSIHLRSRQ